jgi:hypothetical protein
MQVHAAQVHMRIAVGTHSVPSEQRGPAHDCQVRRARRPIMQDSLPEQAGVSTVGECSLEHACVEARQERCKRHAPLQIWWHRSPHAC